MTIVSKFDHEIEIACDGCGFVLETETTDFKKARKLMRGIFWKNESVVAADGEVVWSHFCGECRPQPAGRSRT